MADITDGLNNFLTQDNLLLLAVGAAVVFFVLILIKKFKKPDGMPDFVGMMHKEFIEDEKFNIPDKDYGLKRLYRGDVLLGKIYSFSQLQADLIKEWKMQKEGSQSYTPKRAEDNPAVKKWEALAREETDVYTVVFKKPSIEIPYINVNLYFGKKYQFKWTGLDYFEMSGNDLIFPENVALTAFGRTYVTQGSYYKTSGIIHDMYNAKLFELNVQLFAAKMNSISAETPEMSHQLAMERLRIQAAIEAKQVRTGSNLGL